MQPTRPVPAEASPIRNTRKLLKDGERGDGEMTPLTVMNNFYWKPPFRQKREEDLLTSVLQSHTGDNDYPGDFVASENWPGGARSLGCYEWHGAE